MNVIRRRKKVKLTIDGQEITAPAGASVLEAALANDIYIPHLCHHPALPAAGACRMCLVEVGEGQMVMSCRTPVAAGMVIRTKSPGIDRLVRPVIEMLIADHHESCRGCPSSGHCELQRVMAHLRIDRRRVRRLKLPDKQLPLDTSSPCFDYDPNRCVLCGICVQTCAQRQGESMLHFVERGYGTKIAYFGDETQCSDCGKECMARCPVGVLLPKSAPPPEEA
ncbi:MAG: 2Fe-2S iron-sulfur cluster-binding protein [Chloroflexota bacterium]